jgi:hypothetical protein
VRNREYGNLERREVDVCPFDLKVEGLLDPREEGAGFFKASGPGFSAAFAVAATVQLAHYSIHCDKDCRRATRQRSLLRPSDRAVLSLLSCFTLLCEPCGPTIEGGAPTAFTHSEPTIRTTPDLSRELIADPPSTCNHGCKCRAVDHA